MGGIPRLATDEGLELEETESRSSVQNKSVELPVLQLETTGKIIKQLSSVLALACY